ncbi:MAG: hypothetical protein U0235_31710 [Polyangiaceae bacterium]
MRSATTAGPSGAPVSASMPDGTSSATRSEGALPASATSAARPVGARSRSVEERVDDHVGAREQLLHLGEVDVGGRLTARPMAWYASKAMRASPSRVRARRSRRRAAHGQPMITS